MKRFFPSQLGFAALFFTVLAVILVADLAPTVGLQHKFISRVSSAAWIVTAVSVAACFGVEVVAFVRGTLADKVTAIICALLTVGLICLFTCAVAK